MTQDEANVYWQDKEWKKFVVTLERGPQSRTEREIKYVLARNSRGAVDCAKRNAHTLKNPTRVACRLATAFDLGCVRVGAA